MFNKIKTRALSGLIFLLIIIGALTYSKETAAILFLGIAISMAFEYERLALGQFKVVGVFGVLISVLPGIGNYFGYFEINPFIAGIGISLVYSAYAIYGLYSKLDVMQHSRLHLFHCLLYLGIPFYLLSEWLFKGASYSASGIIGLFVLIWICDTGAYMFGSRFGKTPLFKKVSPNKTIEGSLGAGISTLIGAAIVWNFSQQYSLLIWLLIGLAVWVFGTYGDLVESALKRYFKVKDSGSIMPGHGGFLDRFDSFIFVIPFVSLILYFF